MDLVIYHTIVLLLSINWAVWFRQQRRRSTRTTEDEDDDDASRRMTEVALRKKKSVVYRTVIEKEREIRRSDATKSNTHIDVTSEWLVSEGGGQTTLTCLGLSDRQTKIR